MRRKLMSRKRSKRIFRKTSGTRSKNVKRSMRGGYRI